MPPLFASELVGKQYVFALGGEGEEPKHLRTWLSSAARWTGGFLSLLPGQAVAAAIARQRLDTVRGGLLKKEQAPHGGGVENQL